MRKLQLLNSRHSHMGVLFNEPKNHRHLHTYLNIQGLVYTLGIILHRWNCTCVTSFSCIKDWPILTFSITLLCKNKWAGDDIIYIISLSSFPWSFCLLYFLIHFFVSFFISLPFFLLRTLFPCIPFYELSFLRSAFIISVFLCMFLASFIFPFSSLFSDFPVCLFPSFLLSAYKRFSYFAYWTLLWYTDALSVAVRFLLRIMRIDPMLFRLQSTAPVIIEQRTTLTTREVNTVSISCILFPGDVIHDIQTLTPPLVTHSHSICSSR